MFLRNIRKQMSVLWSGKTRKRIDRMVSFTSVSGKVREKILLEYISGHIRQNSMNRNSQGGFSKEKTCLTKLLD